jgi:ribosome biogenesis protein ERB1
MAPSKRDANGSGRRQPLWDSDKDLQAEDLDLSSSDEEVDEEAQREEEITDAVLDYVQAARRQKKNRRRAPKKNAAGGGDEDGDEADSESGDSDKEDELVDFDSEGEEEEEEEEELIVGSDDNDEENDDEDNSASSGGSSEEEEGEEDVLSDPASDSSEDERPNRNTIGDVPLNWYRDEEHVGYDVDGTALTKKGRRDALDKLLARSDSAKEYRTIYDEYNDEEIVLSKEEMRMIQRIRAGKFAHIEVNPFEPENDWFTRDPEIMPLSGAPEPKRRFIPSKWEEKRVVKLVRAMRKGWIKRTEPEEAPTSYLMWEDDGKVADKQANGLTYIPAPKLKLPGHEESYNPPKEYLPSEEEKNAAIMEAEYEGERPPFQPTAYEALRKVPAYENFIRERFERCLDLYLCPRARIKRLNVDDPKSLVPRLPKPKDLQPFPTLLSLRFLGHRGPIRSLCTDPTGQWLLSGSADGSVKLWEVQTARCLETWEIGEVVTCVAWCPKKELTLAAIAAGNRVLLLPLYCGNDEQEEATKEALETALEAAATTAAAADGAAAGGSAPPAGTWKHAEDTKNLAGAVEIPHNFPVKHVSWHNRGDYFSSVAPTGNTRAVLVHQLTRGASQNPFRKNRGRVVRALFHPTKPFFFVATQQAIRVYNLAKQSLAKKLIGGSGVITSMDIHPSGDHLIVGAEDKRVCWYDLDLSTKPYRALRYHTHAVRAATFHPRYPLFASSSDDASVHVFHGMVYADLMTNPLIVPVKILRGHTRNNAAGVNDVVFHPTQPWIFTGGADSNICLFVNP